MAQQKKSVSTSIATKADAPKSLEDCTFFKRLSFQMSDEQKEFRDAIYDKQKKIVWCNAKSGSGKAQPKTTMIPTPDGPRAMGDLKVGDYVFDRFGSPTQILGVYDQGLQEAYEITFADGRKTICAGEHLWTYYGYRGHFVTETLNSMLERGIKSCDRGYRYSIPTGRGANYPTKVFSIDPYVVGSFLGNGCCTCKYLTLSSNDEDNVQEVARLLNSVPKRSSEHNYNWYFYDKENNHLLQTSSVFATIPELMELSGYKSIPEEYFYGSREQRLSLIQGLMDTDGGCDYSGGRYNIRYCSTSLSLANGLMEMLHSLGYTATITKEKRDKYKSGGCYTVHFRVANQDKPCFFRLPRKKNVAVSATREVKDRKYDRVLICDVQKLPSPIDMVCIYVDNPEHLYLTNDYIVTHNTTIAMATACAMVEFGLYNRIIYIFAPVGFDNVGLLPGTLEDKTAPFIEPAYEALIECGYMPEKIIKQLSQTPDQVFVDCQPHTFLRGVNYDNSIIIIDEAQNFYIDELKKVLTRTKDNCKVVVIGHDGQCDLYKHPERSGFVPYLTWFQQTHDDKVAICNLTQNFRGWVSNIADNFNL